MSYKRLTDNRLKGALGEIDFQKGTIRINKKKAKKAGKGEVLKTIVHEERHRKQPELGEKATEAAMEREVRKLPPALKQAYYDKYPNK